jgi:hypothetical protein
MCLTLDRQTRYTVSDDHEAADSSASRGDTQEAWMRPDRKPSSHRRWEYNGHCKTTVPVHPGEVLGIGLMNKIERDMEHCLGEGWLQ